MEIVKKLRLELKMAKTYAGNVILRFNKINKI